MLRDNHRGVFGVLPQFLEQLNREVRHIARKYCRPRRTCVPKSRDETNYWGMIRVSVCHNREAEVRNLLGTLGDKLHLSHGRRKGIRQSQQERAAVDFYESLGGAAEPRRPPAYQKVEGTLLAHHL
jgi:hypothetical protein